MRLPAAALLLVVACSSTSGSSSGTSISAASYGGACAADSDCVAVFSGDVCAGAPCLCPNDAILASLQSQYEDDLHAKARACPSASDVCNESCVLPPVQCVAAMCVMKW